MPVKNNIFRITGQGDGVLEYNYQGALLLIEIFVFVIALYTIMLHCAINTFFYISYQKEAKMMKYLLLQQRL